MVPRIQGRVIKVGKLFSFEFFVSILGQPEADRYKSNKTWPTRDKAMVALKDAVRIACEAIQTATDGKPNGYYIDMKTNETKKWETH